MSLFDLGVSVRDKRRRGWVRTGVQDLCAGSLASPPAVLGLQTNELKTVFCTASPASLRTPRWTEQKNTTALCRDGGGYPAESGRSHPEILPGRIASSPGVRMFCSFFFFFLLFSNPHPRTFFFSLLLEKERKRERERERGINVREILIGCLLIHAPTGDRRQPGCVP